MGWAKHTGSCLVLVTDGECAKVVVCHWVLCIVSRNSSLRFPEGIKVQSESRLSVRLGAASVVILLTTVCLLPWIHGGNIPLARLILQVGSAGAALLSLVSCILSGDRTEFPRIIVPLGVLAAVGVMQLSPVHAPMIRQMNHAVLAELRTEFIDFTKSEVTVGTPSPGDTRMMVAQLVALMLLAMTAFDQVRTQRAVIASLTVFTANASALSLLAIVQLFRTDLFLIRHEWWTGLGLPFGPFVNPNNAAGWLTLGLASAIGLLVLNVETSYASRGHSPRDQRLISLMSGIGRYTAALTSRKVLVWFSVAVIACGIAATGSRGGMIAAAVALVGMTLARLQSQRLAGIVVVLLAGGAAASSLMVFLNLHHHASLELQTLRDPVSELAGRFYHWRDSLQAVLDFPVLGGGLGAYRYVTLPYQTRDAGVWFQNADNHYVEVVVEAGIVGCVAFVMLGLPILIRAIYTVRQSIAGAAGRSALVLALVLVFAIVAQGVSALSDFGAGLPAASSLCVVLISMFSAVQAPWRTEGYRSSSRITARCMRFVLIPASVVFVGDLLAAHECYVAVIAGRKLQEQPISWEAMCEREILLDRTTVALEARSDDARTHELLSQLHGDIARSWFLEGLPGLETQDRFQSAWAHTACLSIARRIGSLSGNPTKQEQLRRVFSAYLNSSGIADHANRIVDQNPLAAPVVKRAARWSASAGTDDQADVLHSRARFIEPSNGQLGLELGELALLSGQSSRAVAIWKQALMADDSLRYHILAVYSMMDRLDAGLDIFGPSTYSQAVGALMQSRRPDLTVRLRESAETLWTESESLPTKEHQRLRDDHLRHLGDLKARIKWLEQCVSWQPDNLQFHQDLATLYAAVKRWGESEDEWYEVLRLDPDNRTAARGIVAIRRERNSRRK